MPLVSLTDPCYRDTVFYSTKHLLLFISGTFAQATHSRADEDIEFSSAFSWFSRCSIFVSHSFISIFKPYIICYFCYRFTFKGNFFLPISSRISKLRVTEFFYSPCPFSGSNVFNRRGSVRTSQASTSRIFGNNDDSELSSRARLQVNAFCVAVPSQFGKKIPKKAKKNFFIKFFCLFLMMTIACVIFTSCCESRSSD